MSHKLEVDSVHLQFGSKRILSDVYLKCETGKITGLLGQNGTGKSSLMQLAFGTIKCEKSVRIDGRIYKEAFGRPQRLRYLPQFHFIPKSFSLGAVFKDFDLDGAALLNIFPEFSSKIKYSMGTFSGGERRLIELFVIVKSTSLFALLDEPFAHLAPLQIQQVKKLLTEEKANKGILISDHMYKQVLDISDSVYVLKDGTLYGVDNCQEIVELGYAK